jgi:exopolysaccharide biosynthesis protein
LFLFRYSIYFTLLFISISSNAQVRWLNVDSAFQPLPDNFHVYKTTDSLDGKPFIAYYAEAKLKDRQMIFTADTSKGRRLTPLKFYEKNAKPLLVVNCTFFSFETNRNLNAVIMDGKLVAFNNHNIPMRGKDTFQYRHPLGSAIGIDKKRNADIAWLYTDSSLKRPFVFQEPKPAIKDSSLKISAGSFSAKKKWKMKTAIGGGPVLLQNGQIKITNNEELKFTGKAIDDKHPRTCMGYTADGRLIIMVIEGRHPGIAEGATLTLEARLLKDIGCVEALNLDGGGSTCMLINGKETITPSDKGLERPVPAVFIIDKK